MGQGVKERWGCRFRRVLMESLTGEHLKEMKKGAMQISGGKSIAGRGRVSTKALRLEHVPRSMTRWETGAQSVTGALRGGDICGRSCDGANPAGPWGCGEAESVPPAMASP